MENYEKDSENNAESSAENNAANNVESFSESEAESFIENAAESIEENYVENTSESIEESNEDNSDKTTVDEVEETGISVDSEEELNEEGGEASAEIAQLLAGTPVETSPQADKTAKNKKPIMIFCAVAAIAAVFAAAMFFFTQTPEKLLAKAKKVTNGDYAKVVENAWFSKEKTYIELTPETEIDFSLTANNISSMTGLPLFLLNGANITGSINTDEVSKKLETQLSIGLKNEVVANLNTILEDAYLAMNIPELLGDKYISANFKTLNEDLSKSFITSYMQIPEYDYEAAIDGIFNMTESINEINKANAEMYSEGGSETILPDVLDTLENSKEYKREISKGQTEDVNGIKCTLYEVNYPPDGLRETFRDTANQFLDEFEQNLGDRFDNAEQMIPEIDGYYSGQLAELVKQIEDSISKVEFNEPLRAGYYIDGKNKIRRSLYRTTITYEGKSADISLDINKNGEGNIYDNLNSAFSYTSSDNSLKIEWVSKGEHASKSVFTDKSNIKISYSDSIHGGEGAFTINSALNYDPAENRTKLDIDATEDNTSGTLVFGYDMKTEADANNKTSKTTFDEIYFEIPSTKASFSASHEIGPAKQAPKSISPADCSEILKLTPNELNDLMNGVYENYETLYYKVLELLGF